MRNILIVTAGLCICATAEAGPVKIDGPRIRLADLIGSAGGELEIGPAPSPGSRRRIYRREVAHLLKPGKRPARLPRHWDVVTNKQELSCKELARRVAVSLRPSLRTGLAVTAVSCHRPLVLPAGDVRVEAHMGNGTRWAGRLPVTVTVSAGRWPGRILILQTQVDGVVQAVVAASDLRAGDVPAVRLVSRRASTLAWDAVTSKRELVGMKLTGRVRAGAVIRRSMLTPVPIVKRGAVVTLAVVLRGIQLTSRAVARQDGRRGDTILVLSKATNRLIRARVVGPRRVVIEL